MRKSIDITNKRFGRLTAIKLISVSNQCEYWLCKCDCGNEKIIRKKELLSNKTKSCGCFQKELTSIKFTKHGKRETRLYKIYYGMLKRCYNPKSISYSYYGKNGIEVCEEWKNDFISFYKWALSSGYNDNLTIDRINNNKNYEPNNCRWVTVKQQNRNKSDNHFITYNGETLLLCDWSNKTGINISTLSERLRRGWSIEKTIETPVCKYCGKVKR